MKIIRANEKIDMRRGVDGGTAGQRQAVGGILDEVKKRGDAALAELTKRFDGVELKSFNVEQEEIQSACREMDTHLMEAIREAAENIRDFHRRQVQQSWITTKEDGTMLGQKVVPLDAVGVYVPGGTAPLASSLLMGAIPAQIAGVGRIVVATPPQRDGTIASGVLAAANELGIREIYKVGGAQAIGALAIGTETISPVDKIVGPGNAFVAEAKRQVFGMVDIDSIAGPSEIAVIADETADPRYVAADLLSQAEHDVRSAAVLFTPSPSFAEDVAREVRKQLENLPRKAIAEQSLRDHGKIYVVKDVEDAVTYVNEFAPEHVEVMVANPYDCLGKIRHAGAVFLGPDSSEPVGDYFAGPNHVLPTSGTARFSGPLGVDDFTKKTSIISYSSRAIGQNAGKIAALARLEGLEAHARAVEIRSEGKR
ncbi:MAG TPA: histidinol dehydrogenase [Bacillales bacterium]|nr:histidinol dehydrogenase [Bacillales bacterium]